MGDLQGSLQGAAAANRPQAAAVAAAEDWTDGLIVADPRTWRLGYRIYIPQAWSKGTVKGHSVRPGPSPGPLHATAASIRTAAAFSSSEALAPADECCLDAIGTAGAAGGAVGAVCEQQPGALYEVYRQVLGVCEGPEEVGIATQLPLSLNFDFLRYVAAHNKGCFVGQEVLTRSIHQLSNRRRIGIILQRAPPLSEAPSRRDLQGSSSAIPAHESRDGPLRFFVECGVPPAVADEWQGAIDAAIRRMSNTKEVEEWCCTSPQHVSAGDRVYRQIMSAAAAAGGEGENESWAEVGVVLCYSEKAGGGLCLLRSRPGEGPLKTPQASGCSCALSLS